MKENRNMIYSKFCCNQFPLKMVKIKKIPLKPLTGNIGPTGWNRSGPVRDSEGLFHFLTKHVVFIKTFGTDSPSFP